MGLNRLIMGHYLPIFFLLLYQPLALHPFLCGAFLTQKGIDQRSPPLTTIIKKAMLLNALHDKPLTACLLLYKGARFFGVYL